MNQSQVCLLERCSGYYCGYGVPVKQELELQYQLVRVAAVMTIIIGDKKTATHLCIVSF